MHTPVTKLLVQPFLSLLRVEVEIVDAADDLERAPAALAERLQHLGAVPRAVLVAAGFAGQEIAGLDIAAPEAAGCRPEPVLA